MASAGLRLGAIPRLKVGHLIKIPEYNIYQINAYANSRKSSYYTFCTSECATAIDNYMKWRRDCGERITEKSPLIRSQFDSNDIFDISNNVKAVGREGIKKCLNKVLYRSGLRTQLTERRNDENKLNLKRDVPMAHGFRKFFDTTATVNGMYPIYIEFCMGHSLKGVKDSYFYPAEDKDGIYRDILEGNDKSPGYVSVMDALTINDENRLKRQIQKLKTEKSEMDQMKAEMESLRKEKAETDGMFTELANEIKKLKKTIFDNLNLQNII